MTGYGVLVVGVDGSDASARALRWALAEGRRRCAPVHTVMAWTPHAVLAGPGPMLMSPGLAPHHVRDQHWEDLKSLVRGCMGATTTPEVHTELVEGDAAEVLAERAAHAAMLVLGDRGHGRVADAILGSTALRCIHRARCPVLVIPEGMPEQTGDDAQAGVASLDPALD
ncbi:Nucleotide-binding universal stress protein, UspA family [Saccharopolyspora shandongensis]|uniref:Nucleotide-binding universal stress protein, UspA family n=1 Tax=Saccharopolyspora shandongensis TaxID=418495 RepID=A0A1H3EA51_9PSEU|nr:universal stress protein [Saccharopolyspora shandongensis]SDX75470.1 Nucleotide-binding universal stress protein, UspA family [Saccharopolyspora shandongensis]